VAIEAHRFVRKNLSFAVLLRDRFLAIQPLYLSDGSTGAAGECLLHSGIHRHTGLAIADDLQPSDIKAVRSVAMRHILDLANREDVDRVQINTHNLAPVNLSLDREEIPFWVEDFGFQLGLAFASSGMQPVPGMATCSADQIVDLGPTEEALFSRLDDRDAVRKAQRHGLTFADGQHATDVEEYYSLARRSATRTGEDLPQPEYYREIWNGLRKDGRCAFLFANYKEQRVAALILVIDKGAASYFGGISDPNYLSMRVNDFLHWEAMLWAKRGGLHHYRFGPWFPEVPRDWPIARVSAFKNKFGGRSYSVIQGSWFRRPEKYLIAGGTLLAKLCKTRAL
jgi:hypothetical protein